MTSVIVAISLREGAFCNVVCTVFLQCGVPAAVFPLRCSRMPPDLEAEMMLSPRISKHSIIHFDIEGPPLLLPVGDHHKVCIVSYRTKAGTTLYVLVCKVFVSLTS